MPLAWAELCARTSSNTPGLVGLAWALAATVTWWAAFVALLAKALFATAVECDAALLAPLASGEGGGAARE